ncbi:MULTISPECIES: MFS transporter [unclassified Streptomyces]|uniref:MFS transporter n=1 Tax=unclassified Streptomyces TaxID=2593676 RepID=UPI000C272DC6|nr:MFS transporter [Streptomyces sp. CB02959]PJN33691.1 MFS transporter [Streptomyces sp. CB02959]
MNDAPRTGDPTAGTATALSGAVPAKRWLYVIPVAAIMYMLAYLDRNNVSVVLPYMHGDLDLSNADKGLAGGIFFLGYVFLQIPAAVLAQRWSARKTVLILMVAWGLSAVLSGLVQSRAQFYAARFVLGFFEGGVWPAVLILLASWFPLRERARANALWMACLPLSSVLMAPLSGWMLDHASWRWVLVLQGVPPLLWALVWWFAVSDRPAQARWISPAEADHLARALAADEAAKPATGGGSYLGAVRQRSVLVLIGVYFFWITGFYGFSLWLPAVIKELTHNGSATEVGLLTAVPFTVALVVMIGNAVWSDRTGRRRQAVAIPLVVGIAALLLGQAVHGAVPRMLLLCVTAAAVYAPYGPFWAIPGQLLRFEVVAVAMGLINALGNLGGFAGPYLVGWLTDVTGTSLTGFAVLAGFLAVAVILVTLGLRPGPARPGGGSAGIPSDEANSPSSSVS